MSALIWMIENTATFVELFCGSLFCAAFLPKSERRMTVRVMICALSALLMYAVDTLITFSPVTFLCGMVLLLGTQAVIFRKTPIRAALLALLFMIVIVISDNIVVRLISFTADVPFSSIYQEMSIYRILAVICSKVFLIFVTFPIFRLCKRAHGMKLRYLFAVSAVTIAMLLIGSAMVFIDVRQGNVSSGTSILFFVMMLVTLFTMYFGTFAILDRYQARQQMELVDMKNKMLEQSMRETEQTFQLWKTSLHDHKHRLAALKVMADNGDLEELRVFLDKENELFRQKMFYYKTGNDTVDTILNMKQHTAESKHIPFMIHAVVPERCTVSAAHFAAILGNLLDNAMEAAEHADKPFIEVKIGEVKDNLLISVSNSYDPENACQKDRAFHGIGFNSVRNIVSEYGGDHLTEQDENVYHTKIMIPLS